MHGFRDYRGRSVRYDADRVKDFIVSGGDSCPPPAPLWCQIEASTASRVLIVTIAGDSTNHQLAYTIAGRARRHLGKHLQHVSVLHLGPDPTTEHLAEVEDLCAATGGFFVTCDTIHSVSPIISSLTQAFLGRAEGLSRLLQQRRENHAKLNKLRVGQTELSNGDSSAEAVTSAAARLLLPSACMLEGLRDVTQSIPWLWGRAVREWRAWAFGVRDVAFSEPGPLGLDVAAPPPTWRVAATHPPASVLTLSPQISIAAIGSVALSRTTSRRTLSRVLSMRPVGLTLGDPYVRDLPSAAVGHLACLIVAEVMTARVTNPFKHNPPPVPSRDPSNLSNIEGHHLAGVPTRVLILVVEYACDLQVVGKLGLCCKALHREVLVNSRTDRKSIGFRMIRYCLRNGALRGRPFRASFLAWSLSNTPTKEFDRESFLAENWLGFRPTDVLGRVASEDIGGSAATPSDWLCLHRRRCLRRLSCLVDLCMPAYFGALDGRLAGRLRADGVSIELAVANLALNAKLGGVGVVSDVASWEDPFWSESEPLCDLLYPLRLVIAAVLVHKRWILDNAAENVRRNGLH